MDNILTITNDDLERLSPEEAVEFFSQLLWSEATAIGLAKSLINIPSAINVADGGIDAEIKDAHITGGQGIIEPGLTRYQIKTGKFNLSQDTYIKEVLFRDGTQELKPRVKTCLDQDGTFVVVLFGWDGAEQTDDQVIGKIHEILDKIDPKYQTAKIKIWQQNTLRGFIQQAYPSLALQINGRSRARFDTHATWSTQEQMRTFLVDGENQVRDIEGIRTQLRQSDPGTHIRVLGEPGVGKTRMVLEATRQIDLAPLVIYTRADSLIDSELLTEIMRGKFQAILVIDECDPGKSAYFTDRLKYQCPKIQVVSIYSDLENASGISYIEASPLSDGEISKIIQSYGVTKDQADRWADYCSGSPRVAHVVGFNLNTHPEDILREPSSVRIWERYIAGKRDVNSEEFRMIQLVLRYLALFKRFGYGAYLAQEADSIADLIHSRNPEISKDRFHEIIRELRSRKILQGENTLYITPKLLHIKLWIDWWENYGRNFDINSLGLSAQLLDWFFEMFEYASASEVATQRASELLGKDGPFQNDHVLLKSKLGARFFHYLAKAEPQAALYCLQRTLGTWSLDERQAFGDGRRDVIWALEYIIAWRNLFIGGARLLLDLAEAENETWSNNASGVFAEIFKISIDPELSRTEASPQERFPLLRETLESDSQARRFLGLRACEMALTTYTSGVIGRYQNPLQRKPNLWKPQTWGELFDAYSQVWNLVYSKVDSLPPEESQRAVQILTGAARGIAHYLNINEMVLQTLETLSTKTQVDKRLIVETVTHLLRYDGAGLPGEVRQKWEALRDRLVGTDLHSRLVRYIGMNLIEDRVDENGKVTSQHEETVIQLADEASQNPEIILAELTWLLSSDSPHVYNFGFQIGQRDSQFILLPEITRHLDAAGESLNLYFVGGYLRAFREKYPDRWEDLLDTFTSSEKLKGLIPELTRRSGFLSERSAQRILRLLLEQSIEPGQLMHFAYGQATNQVNEVTVIEWIEALLDRKSIRASSVALTIYTNYYLDKSRKSSPPADLTFRLVTSPGLVEITDPPYRDQMAGYYWNMICQAFVNQQPDYAINLARFILDNFDNDKSIVGGFSRDAQAILTLIASLHPHEMWNCITDYITLPLGSCGFHIRHWLRGADFWGEEAEGALVLMHPDDVWNWVEQNVEQRAWFIAVSAPKVLAHREDKVCWAREILIRYGHRDDVRRNLISNFSTEGWTGPTSLHLQRKIDHLIEFSSKETNKTVLSWIDEYVARLQEQLKQARIEEEREDY